MQSVQNISSPKNNLNTAKFADLAAVTQITDGNLFIAFDKKQELKQSAKEDYSSQT